MADQPPAPFSLMDARSTALALLARRAPGKTVCPSEVARALSADADLGADRWRAAMPDVHAAVDGLVGARLVRLSWKGVPLAARAGPYRIGRGARFPEPG